MKNNKTPCVENTNWIPITARQFFNQLKYFKIWSFDNFIYLSINLQLSTAKAWYINILKAQIKSMQGLCCDSKFLENWISQNFNILALFSPCVNRSLILKLWINLHVSPPYLHLVPSTFFQCEHSCNILAMLSPLLLLKRKGKRRGNYIAT